MNSEWYFDDDANFAALLTELETWRGTPFAECAQMKGVGADCARFVERALVNIGAIDPAPFPRRYVTRGGGEKMLQVFCDAMDAMPRLQRLWTVADPVRPPYMRGDVLLVSTGKAMHHLAVCAELPLLWHNLHGVGHGSVWDPLVVQHLHRLYRVKVKPLPL